MEVGLFYSMIAAALCLLLMIAPAPRTHARRTKAFPRASIREGLIISSSTHRYMAPSPPSNKPHTMSTYRFPSPAPLSMKTATKPTDLTRMEEFITLQLGESRQSVRVPIMPSIFANTCYDYFANQVLPLRYIVPPAEIIATYASHFPINTMSAENEAKTIGQSIYDAFFQTSNIKGHRFYNTSVCKIIFKDTHTTN